MQINRKTIDNSIFILNNFLRHHKIADIWYLHDDFMQKIISNNSLVDVNALTKHFDGNRNGTTIWKKMNQTKPNHDKIFWFAIGTGTTRSLYVDAINILSAKFELISTKLVE